MLKVKCAQGPITWSTLHSFRWAHICAFFGAFLYLGRSQKVNQIDDATDDVLRYARIFFFFGSAWELISQTQFKDSYNNLSFSKLG